MKRMVFAVALAAAALAGTGHTGQSRAIARGHHRVERDSPGHGSRRRADGSAFLRDDAHCDLRCGQRDRTRIHAIRRQTTWMAGRVGGSGGGAGSPRRARRADSRQPGDLRCQARRAARGHSTRKGAAGKRARPQGGGTRARMARERRLASHTTCLRATSNNRTLAADTARQPRDLHTLPRRRSSHYLPRRSTCRRHQFDNVAGMQSAFKGATFVFNNFMLPAKGD